MLQNTTEFISYKNKIKIYNYILYSMVVIITLLFFIFVWVYFDTGSRIKQEYMTVLTSEYGNWDNHIDNERDMSDSGLYVFSPNISNAKKVKYLYYASNNYHSINQNLIFAEVTYSEADYEKEIARLTGVECKVQLPGNKEEVINHIEYSEELFSYPAYIAIYGSHLQYEYALIDEKNSKVVYVYSKHKNLNSIIPEEYIPLEVIGKDMFEENSWDNTNIYYTKSKAGDYISYLDSSENKE